MLQPKRQNTFNRALPIIAQLLADKIGVRIDFAPGTPCTDGERIRIPKVRTTDRKEEIEVLSSLIHEAGHVRFTDFNAQPGPSKFEKVLANALEDPRIENLMNRRYYGAIGYFERAFKESMEQDLLAAVDRTDACDLLCLYVMTRAHCVLLGHTYTEVVYNAVRERMSREAGSQLLAKLDDVLDRRFPKCRSTDQVIELARDIAPIVCNHQPPTQGQGQSEQSAAQAPSSGQGQTDTDSVRIGISEGTSDSQSDQKTAGNSTKSQNSSGKAQKTAAKGSSSQETRNTQSQSGAEEKPSQQAGSNSKSHKSSQKGEQNVSQRNSGEDSGKSEQQKTAHEAWKEAKNNRRDVKCSWDTTERFIKVCSEPVSCSKSDGSESSILTNDPFSLESLKRRLPNGKEPLDSVCAQQLLEEGLQQTCGLRRALQKLIVERERRCDRLASSGTRIRSGTLARLAVGNTKVFGKMTEVRGVSTAVHVLLDGSGSMSGGKFDLAIKSSLAIVHSLQSVRSVSVGLSLFQGYRSTVLIRHGETINQNLGRIGLCDYKGGTPLYTALLSGAYQLSQRTEVRKVLIILSDLRETEIDDYSQQAIKDLSQAGIIVVGITIGDSKAAEAFPYATNIRDLADLGPALFEATSKIFR